MFRVIMERSKFMMVGRKGVASQVKLKRKGKLWWSRLIFRHLRGCFSKDREQQEGVKKRVSKGLKTSGTVKMMLDVRTVSLGVKREL